MHCRRCGTELADQAVACTSCGVAPLNGGKYCNQCGAETLEEAIVCVKCGVSLKRSSQQSPISSKRLAAALCGILLGSLGIHKFVLGYWLEGAIMLAISVVSLTLLWWVPAIIGMIEGIIYLTRSDAEFEQIYVENKRGWF